MSHPPRIMLVSHREIAINPLSDQVVQSHWEPGNLLDSEIRPLGVTHWALASNCKSLSSTTLVQAAMTAQPPIVLVLPLEGCEWISVFSDALYRMSHILLKCAVIVCPMLPRENEPTQFFTRESDLRLSIPDRSVGQPLHPFRMPLLCPPPLAHEDSGFRFSAGIIYEPPLDNVAYNAGLALMDDNLELGHNLAQSIEGHPDGDYWHAIMHRREPDYGNSKYWFRHVGRHPAFAPLASRAAEIMNDAPTDVRSHWASRLKLDAGWDPFAFVDLCEAAAGDEESDLGLTARRIQWSEMLLLLRHCAQTK